MPQTQYDQKQGEGPISSFQYTLTLWSQAWLKEEDCIKSST